MNSEARIVANSLLAFVARSWRALVALLLVPFLLSRLGENAYGVIGVIHSLLAFMVLVELGVRPAAARQFTHFLFAGEGERANQLASTAMALYVTMALLILVATMAGARPLLAEFGIQPPLLDSGATAIVLASIALGVTLITTPYMAALASQLRHDIQHYTDILEATLRGSLIVAIFVLWEPTLTAWAAAAVAAALAVLVVTRTQAYRLCPRLELHSRQVSRRGLRDLAGFSAYTSIYQLADWLNTQSGPLIVGLLLGPIAVAHYTPALVVGLALQTLSRAFLIPLQPFLTRAAVESDVDLIRRVLFRSTRYSILLSGGAAVWVGSLSHLLISCWLGPGFEDSVAVLRLWCAAIFFSSLMGAAFSVFLGMGRMRGVSALNALISVGTLVASVALLRLTALGIAAVALAVAVAELIRSLIWITLATRIVMGEGRAYLRESYLGPLFTLGVAGTLSAVVQSVVEAGPWTELLLAGLPALIALSSIGWFGGLSADDRNRALSYLRRALAVAAPFLRHG